MPTMETRMFTITMEEHMKKKYKITIGFVSVSCILVAFALALQEPAKVKPEKVSNNYRTNLNNNIITVVYISVITI